MTAGLPLLLLAALQAAVQPPRAVPFDCSWILGRPNGHRERFDGIYFSFIDNHGFTPCTGAACREWMGAESIAISFSPRASAQLRKRRADTYGVFKIAFEGAVGQLRHRPGCEPGRFSLDAGRKEYVLVTDVLALQPLGDPATTGQARPKPRSSRRHH